MKEDKCKEMCVCASVCVCVCVCVCNLSGFGGAYSIKESKDVEWKEIGQDEKRS